ncbi:MAG: hypothetical protein ACI4MT_05595 [Christensenellales bacterium]
MKKNFIISVLLVLLTVIACFTLTACSDKDQGSGTVSNVKSDEIVVTGEFEVGSTLEAASISADSEKGETAILKISDKAYNKEKCAIYDISVFKSGNKVQPGKKVKVTMPAPFESETGYVTFHINDDVVETLETTYENGKITFETESFSVFIVAAQEPEVEKFDFKAYADGASQGYVINTVTPETKVTEFSYKLTAIEAVRLQAEAKVGYEFVGWYTGAKTDGSAVLISTESTYSFTKNYSVVYARFNEIVSATGYVFSATTENGTLTIGGVNKGTACSVEELANGDTVTISATENADYYFIGWYTIEDEIETFYSSEAEETFTIDGSNLRVVAKFDEAFKYVGSYTLPNIIREYDGGALFVLKSEIYVYGKNMRDYFDFNVGYYWRDKSTKATVDKADDVTMETQYHMWGPAVVGEYEFVLTYDGVDKLIIPAKVSPRVFEKITQYSDISTTCTRSGYNTVINYYSIIAQAEGKYYAMQMPEVYSESMGTGVTANAIEVTPDENGRFSLGDEYAFVFEPFHYNNSQKKYTVNEEEVLLWDMGTGYFATQDSMIVYVGMDKNIMRYGHTGDSDTLFTFDESGYVTIRQPYMANNADYIRLVKDGENFYFTSVPESEDTRTSYKVNLYRNYVEEYVEPIPEEKYEYRGGSLSKTYDGNKVSFNAYKDVEIVNANGEDLFAMLKCESGYFAWVNTASEETTTATVLEDGTVEGPSEVGEYKLVFMVLTKGGSGDVFVSKLLHEFTIS